MKQTDPSLDQFLKDVATHTMRVIHEAGVYRHIRFKAPGTMCMHFDLITWPGYLCYTGDMGTYVFSRLRDMFEFFRVDREYAVARDRKLYINRSYWSEKLQAVDGDRSGGKAKAFCEEKFKAVINDYRLEWIRSNSETRRSLASGQNDILTKEQRRELWEAVDEEVLCHGDDEHRSYAAAYDFHHRVGGREFYFRDLFEHDFTDYTERFTWCCYALAWGIAQYDAAKNSTPAQMLAHAREHGEMYHDMPDHEGVV